MLLIQSDVTTRMEVWGRALTARHRRGRPRLRSSPVGYALDTAQALRRFARGFGGCRFRVVDCALMGVYAMPLHTAATSSRLVFAHATTVQGMLTSQYVRV